MYWKLCACMVMLLILGCRSATPPTIAVIPRTTGTALWEPEHGGAEAAAVSLGLHIYWNAPTREDNVEGQISLVDHVIEEGYHGLVLTPDHSLALMMPVRRALERDIPTIVVGSPLPIPGGGKLSYILNDEETGGRLAGQRAAALIHGRGSVAILGINPDIAGIMARARSVEQFLSGNYPNIHTVKSLGSFNALHEQQVAEEMLKENPNLDVIIALMWASTRGAMSAIETSPGKHPTKVIGFDPDGALPFEAASLDSAIMMDTNAMGREAVNRIHDMWQNHSVPALTKLQPTLITRENVDTPEVQRLTSMNWRPEPWERSIAP